MTLQKNRAQKNGKPKRMGGYIRVSTGRQAEEGLSLPAQRDRIEQYCDFHGADLVDIVEDNTSAFKVFADRPGGQRILDMMEAGEIDGVVITRLDRAFRNAVDCILMSERWRENRSEFHIIDFGGNQIDTSTAGGRMVLGVLANVAQMERELTAERTAESMAKRRRDGKSLGRGKFGWTLAADGETLVPHEVQQDALKFILHKHREAKWGVRKIATWLRNNGIPTTSDLWWDRKDVQKVLDNPIPGMSSGQKYLREKLVGAHAQLHKDMNCMRALVRMANSSVQLPFPAKHTIWNPHSVESIVENPLVAEEQETK